MYKYITDVNQISHYIIKKFLNKCDIAIDATLGNGYDTDFLSELFSKVYSFDIQEFAIENYKLKNKENVVLIKDSHENFDFYVKEKVDCIVYNLGFLPGGDKNITTKSESTLKSIKLALEILNEGGLIALSIYRGHEEGKKEEAVLMEFLEDLPKNKYAVMLHSFLNRKNSPPYLVIIEKK